MLMVFQIVCFIIFAPLISGLVQGLDRIISARMQGRVGPPVFQPFYDIAKLLQKKSTVVRSSQNIFIIFFLIFMIFSGCLFFTGQDFLLFFFSLMLANIFLILGAYKGSSPYSIIGANRELLQKMAIEPMILIMVMGLYFVTKSFSIATIAFYPSLVILYLPGIFIGFLYILTIKLRKSPFDLSTSHHAHQEIVKGITTEYSGWALAFIEIAHLYELTLIFGMIYLFFGAIPLLAIFMIALTYFFEIVVDNTCARLKWGHMLKSAWSIALVLGVGNLIVLYFYSV